MSAGQPTEDEIAQKANSIARQTMSPFCPGRTLADCPSEYATEWRTEIRAMLKEGKSAHEIQAVLFERAGGDLSGSPNRAASLLLPVLLVLAAVTVLLLTLRRLKKTVPSSSEPVRASSAILDARLEEELSREQEE